MDSSGLTCPNFVNFDIGVSDDQLIHWRRLRLSASRESDPDQPRRAMTSFLGLRDGRFVSYLDQAKPQRHHSILTYAFSIQATNLALAQELLQTIHNKDSCFSPYSAVRRSLESPLPHPLRVVDQQPPLSSDG